MLTLPNFISFLRFPLAFLCMIASPKVRALAITLAMISDGLDGFLARRYNLKSRIGVILDPLADKFFVLFIIILFCNEGRLTFIEATTLFCRDFAVIIFGFYLLLTGHLATYRFRAIWCGKASTFLQFLVLLGLNYNMAIPSYAYTVFVLLGILALLELYLLCEPKKTSA